MSTTRFLLLLGPSGVGKSRIINILRRLDPRYTYISPYTNRVLRDGETDKISVDDEEINRLQAAGELLAINEKFGFRYATPKSSITDALGNHQFPLLDWPIERLAIMREAFGYQLFIVYVEPPSLEVLATRLAKDGRDVSGSRFREARHELEHYWAGDYSGFYDTSVVSYDAADDEPASTVHRYYLDAIT